jgi:hypothetical protein
MNAKNMKKLILLTVLCALSFAGFAQTTDANAFAYKNYRFAITAAPLFCWMTPDTKNIGSEGMRMGWGLGITGEKNISVNAAFTFGLQVNQMGGKILYPLLVTNDNTANVQQNVTYAYRTRYVEAPFTIKLRTDEFGYSRIFAEVGIGVGILWSAKADLDKPLFSMPPDAEGNDDRNVNQKREDFMDQSQSVANEDNISFLRIPVLAGLGYEYALSQNTTVMAGIRYSAGLTDVMRDEKSKAFNNFIAIQLGILF